MAVVRITDNLIADVQAAIHRLYTQQINDADKFPDADTWGDKLWELAFKDYKAAFSALPVHFLAMSHSFDFAGWENCDNPEIRNSGLVFRYKNGQRPDPPANYHVDGTGVETHHSSYYLNARDPRWAEFRAVYEAWYIRKKEVLADLTTSKHNASVMLKRFATLAPALKEWPALWDLLPHSVKEQHKKIVERPKRSGTAPVKKERDPDVPDVSKVTTMLAIKKLGGTVQ